MRIGKFLLSACAISALLTASAYADVGNITVTATRNAAKVAKTPSKVNIITAKQLEEKGIIYVKDALKEIPGIAVSSNGAFGGQTSTYVRGLSTYYTKVLIDGVDVSDPSLMQPQFDFANLTVDDIKRIEIVQGAQSGLYGANAVAGVINIITKKGKGKPYFKYSQKVGSFHTYKETAESGGSLGKFNYYIEGSRLDTDGISKMDKHHTDGSYSRGDEKDGYHKTDFSSRMEYNFDDSLKMGNVLKLYKTQNYLDNGWDGSNPNDSASSNNTPKAKSLRDESHFLMTKFYIDKEIKDFKIDLNAFYMQNLRYYKSAPDYFMDYKGKRWGENIKTLYKINKTKITAGINHTTEKYEDNSPFKNLRYNVGGFLELEQSIENLTFQGVAREDHYKTFGNHFTYKLGANYLVTPTNTILKANYSTGFRSPSIFELYSPLYGGIGNSNLTPERSKSWDFGFAQNFFDNKINLGTTYFKNIITNRIAYDRTTWKYEQVNGNTVSDGVEFEAKVHPMKTLIIGANYTYTKSKDPNTGEQAARIPLRTYTGYATLKALDNKLINTISGRYIGKRFDDSNHAHQTGKYAVFDFASLYNFNKNLEASVSVKNIFNRFYEEAYGYSTLPRSVFAKISYKF